LQLLETLIDGEQIEEFSVHASARPVTRLASMTAAAIDEGETNDSSRTFHCNMVR
jgi:hypothetical protein